MSYPDEVIARQICDRVAHERLFRFIRKANAKRLPEDYAVDRHFNPP